MFDYTKHYAGALIESGSRCSMPNELSRIDFIDDLAYNENNMNDCKNPLYRMSLSWMRSFHAHSGLQYPTCNFDNTYTQQDWLLI